MLKKGFLKNILEVMTHCHVICISPFKRSHFKKQRKTNHRKSQSSPMCPETTNLQVPYCLQEVWPSLVKWVRGESQKQHALTTCDPHLNSFHHDISLNQAYKRLHCIAWCGLVWTRVIVQPDLSQKNKSRMKFGALSRFPAEIITFVRHKMS